MNAVVLGIKQIKKVDYDGLIHAAENKTFRHTI